MNTNDEYVVLMHAKGGLTKLYCDQLHDAGIATQLQSYTADAFSSMAGTPMLGEKILVPSAQLEQAKELLNVETPEQTGSTLRKNGTKNSVFKIIAAIAVSLALISILITGIQ